MGTWWFWPENRWFWSRQIVLEDFVLEGGGSPYGKGGRLRQTSRECGVTAQDIPVLSDNILNSSSMTAKLKRAKKCFIVILRFAWLLFQKGRSFS